MPIDSQASHENFFGNLAPPTNIAKVSAKLTVPEAASSSRAQRNGSGHPNMTIDCR
jgi:hypothetical protein